MQSTACAVTMVRDDEFFLRIWLDYYGELLGHENCYVINHGRGEVVADMAAEANVIGIPGDPHKNFDAKRWRLLNGIVQGLRSYYDHVIVGDVDELVVVDPASGKDLLTFLQKRRTNRVFTPLGLEVVHRLDVEPDPIQEHVLGPRRHVRLAPHYSKPCIVSTGVKISRGGHYTQYDQLNAPDDLYLFHLKFCDFAAYQQAMDRRNAVTAAVNVDTPKDAQIGRHWFAEARGDDRAAFDAFAALPMADGFDMAPYRQVMADTFRPRGDTGFYEFDRPETDLQFELPDRFFGVF
ncbi:glycosyltransferase family 2 protein [Pseudooceanicola sp. MF1-13]|uniref:glycosyltransferase family 2 protein n=1 Tax=Pseudooceanicola sp. MF1-13 TaxID=3379095 RepID=UPI00389178CD